MIQDTMRRTVEWMQSHGFKTTDSGDGAQNVAAGMGCAIDRPHVFATVSPADLVSEADRLCVLASVEGMGGTVEATYSPDDGIAVVCLFGVRDSDWTAP